MNSKRSDVSVISTDLETEGLIHSRAFQRSTSSFVLSLCVHLGIFLILSLVLLEGRLGQLIHLNASTTVEADNVDTLVSIPLEFPAELDAINLDASELDATTDKPLELDTDQFVDLAALDTSAYEAVPDRSTGADQQSLLAGGGGTGFFGIEATGNKIVYIIDMSPSMEAGRYQRRYDRAVNEVLRSVDQLKSDQEFFVYLFCFKKIEMDIGQGKGDFCPPTRSNRNALANWLNSRRLSAGTDPRESLVAALKLKPTCIFLLSDGEFNGMFFANGKYRSKVTTVELAKRHNKSNCPIHTIGLEDIRNQADMIKIARESGGKYQYVPPKMSP